MSRAKCPMPKPPEALYFANSQEDINGYLRENRQVLGDISCQV